MFEGLFQPTHLLIILGIAVLVLGPRKIPEHQRHRRGIRGSRFAKICRQPRPPIERRKAAHPVTAILKTDGGSVSRTNSAGHAPGAHNP
jgi:hypothetical protein